MNGMSEKEERDQRNAEVEAVARRLFGHKPATQAAIKLAQRMYSRNYYRKQRDRRLTHWLGKTFEYDKEGVDELNRRWQVVTIRVDRYDPVAHTVTVWMEGPGKPAPGYVTWDTDDFWAAVRKKRLKRV